jgi:hypothetical protein
VRFAEVRIVKELADGGRLVAWIVMAALGKEKSLTQRAQRAQRTQRTQRRNREVLAWRSIGLRNRGRICWRVVGTREYLPVSPPLQKQHQHTGKRPKVKITGYSNGLMSGLGEEILVCCLPLRRRRTWESVSGKSLRSFQSPTTACMACLRMFPGAYFSSTA